MEIFQHDELDSTSTEVLRLMAAPVRPALPFAVVAAQQSMGRGRQGRSWVSPAGNIYLTLALPCAGLSMARLALSPLLAAVISARFIADKFGLRVTLKWPNDLLVAGRKLGGILCETSSEGGVASAIIVGIGINVANFPELNDENRAISLAEILHASPAQQATHLAYELAHHFAALWDLEKIDAIVAEYYAEFAIENGQLWLDPLVKQRFMTVNGLSPAGHLKLQNLREPTDHEELFSIQKEYYWIYQGPFARSHPLLVADLGNSRFKAALFSGADHLCHLAVSCKGDYAAAALAGLAALRDWLDAHGINENWPIHVASVNREMENLCARHFQKYGLVPVSVPKRTVRLVRAHYDLAQIGIDRLALMEGGLAGAHGCQGNHLIMISAGTATTIDVIDGARRHLGGVILPGLAMHFAGLGEGGSLLPALSLEEACEAWPAPTPCTLAAQLGHDTKEAIARGALLELAGALERIRGSLPREAKAPHVIISGGAGELLAPYLEGAIYGPDLALQGIGIMVRGG